MNITRIFSIRVCLPCLLLAALFLYVFYLPRYYVGCFNDDAYYIIGAKSLWLGRYADLSAPAMPVFNKFGIGYPLFLAPFVKLFAPHWNWLKWVSVGLSLASLLVFSRLACLFLTPGAAAVALALLAFNPVFSIYSGAVMTEPLFILLVLNTFLLLERVLNGSAGKGGVLLGLILGWACLTRPVGALLVFSVAVTLFLAKKWRPLILSSGISLGIWGAQSLRNYFLTRTSSAYFSFWRDLLPYLSNFKNLSENAIRVIHTFLVDGLLGIRLPYEPWAVILSLGLACLCLGIAIRGLFRALAPDFPRRHLAFSIGLFCLTYLILHVLWTAITPRFVLPILPFLILFAVRALLGQQEARSQRWRLFLSAGLCLSLFGTYTYRHAWELGAICAGVRPADLTFPVKALEWLKSNTAQDAVILGKSPLIYLETGRKGIFSLPVGDADEFRYRLLRSGVTHVLFQPSQILEVYGAKKNNEGKMWRQTYFWPLRWTAAFRPVFSDKEEQTEIFEVVQSSAFRRAFEHYRMAGVWFSRGFPEKGDEQLKMALRTDPTLACAWNVAGAISLGKKNIKAAEAQLTRAINLRPCFPSALFHMALVKILQGDRKAAGFYFERSKAAGLALEETEWVEYLESRRLSLGIVNGS
ncbi:MAG: glycosyltransferase family 39 protein [Elusimicrobia bacterium]|nr:glycosyltransferase family 39 protein [Elusimicrobiota bacterium]